MKFQEIGFNDEHLSKLSKEQFKKEVSHLLTDKQTDELYSLIQKKHGNDKRNVSQGEVGGSGSGSQTSDSGHEGSVIEPKRGTIAQGAKVGRKTDA